MDAMIKGPVLALRPKSGGMGGRGVGNLSFLLPGSIKESTYFPQTFKFSVNF